MTFLDLLHSGTSLDCDLIIGGCDMPASFVWDVESVITDYGIERFRKIMYSQHTHLPNGNIEIHCDDYILGEEFCLAAAGYIGGTEYMRIFGDDSFASGIGRC